MKQVVLARNVINQDEVGDYINTKIAEHPAIDTWFDKVLRKWIINKAPTVKFKGATQDGMPDWLKKSISDNTAEQVVIDEKLDNEIAPIIDYLEHLKNEKPNLDLTRVSFDQAAAGSKKWHEDLAKKATRAKPIEEDGTKVIHVFPNGYYWVKVTGLQSMKREGQIMGHCVGGYNYFQHSLGGRKEIYSLRDPKNVPHVTIEVDTKPGHVTINQIKGKANLAVNADYLPMVEAFLKNTKWDTINFDGANPLRAEIMAHRAKDAFVGKNGTTITREISHYFGNRPRFRVTPRNGEEHGYYATDFWELPEPASDDFVDFLLANHVYMDPEYITWTARQGRWTSTPATSAFYVNTPQDARAQVNAKYASRGDPHARLIVTDKDETVGYVTGDHIVLTEDVTTNKRIFDLLEHMPSVPHGKVSVLDQNLVTLTPDVKLTEFYQHRHAGAAASVSDSPQQTLDSFLHALRLPNLAVIRQAGAAVRGKQLSDGEFKSHGIPTGGNSTMAYPLVLALSLSNNRQDALPYLASKPHALRNWLDVMNNKMAPMLNRMKFDDQQKASIHGILFNEYMRLAPTPTELANMDIPAAVKEEIAAAAKQSKRNDPQKSKALWA